MQRLLEGFGVASLPTRLVGTEIASGELDSLDPDWLIEPFHTSPATHQRNPPVMLNKQPILRRLRCNPLRLLKLIGVKNLIDLIAFAF